MFITAVVSDSMMINVVCCGHHPVLSYLSGGVIDYGRTHLSPHAVDTVLIVVHSTTFARNKDISN